MSAKSTVTCLRSPSRAAFEVRIFSARYFGVYACGESDREAVLGPAAASAWPHFRQNLAPERFDSPHPEQMASRRAPHSSQKAASTAFSYWHRGHCILEPPSLQPELAEAFAYPKAGCPGWASGAPACLMAGPSASGGGALRLQARESRRQLVDESRLVAEALVLLGQPGGLGVELALLPLQLVQQHRWEHVVAHPRRLAVPCPAPPALGSPRRSGRTGGVKHRAKVTPISRLNLPPDGC
jgi:hypothetical protein